MDNPSDEAITEALRLVRDCTNTTDVIRRNAERGAAWARNVIAHARTIDQRNKLVEAVQAAQSFIADGGLTETDAGWSVFSQLTAALTQIRSGQ